MAKTPTATKPAKTAKKPAQPGSKTPDYATVTIHGKKGDDLVAMQDRRVSESKGFWNGNGWKLEDHTKENEKLYLGRQISDQDDGDDPNLSLDNRIFSSIRTIVPYVTTRITEPEVYPSSTKIEAKRFAEDFEKALHIKADKEKVKMKLKFALEDGMIRRRGYLKPRYDAATGNWFALEFVPAESIIIDHKAKPYEEPRYFRHHLEKTPEDLIVMFPDMEDRILELFKIPDKTDSKAMQTIYTINEDWFFMSYAEADEEGQDNQLVDLVVCWNYKETALGCIQDPNWRYGKENFLDYHMMPLIFVNVLNDGRTFIDKTSFVEQAKYLQNTIDQRGRQIGENASLGSVGMPVVDSAALADDQSQYLTFEPDTVLELDVNNAGKQSINDVFTTWKAQPLSQDVYNDKTDAIAGVENAFGASNVFQGNQSDNNTLGQDEMLRDQSMGRQAEIIDAIDAAMNRLYLLMAQFLLVYGDDVELFKYVGENSQFDYVVIHSSDLDTNAEIRVRAGTSMPVDNPQRRATANSAAQIGLIDPLSYWEIMDEPNAEKIAKRVVDWKANPAAFMNDTKEEIFNRDAYVDLELIKNHQTPPYRDDLPKEYFDYLNQIVLSGDLENPNLPLETRQAMSQFIDQQLERAQKMLGMAETQLPSAADVQSHNAMVDDANQAPGADQAAQAIAGQAQAAPGTQAPPQPSPVAPAPAQPA